ncbi:hypothetical protein IAT40_000964 [Kwoniella sp. CBS 6097]
MSATPALAVPPSSSPTSPPTPEPAAEPDDTNDQAVTTNPAYVGSNGGAVDMQALRAAAMRSARGKRAKSATTSRAASPCLPGPSYEKVISPTQPPVAEAGPSTIPSFKPVSSPNMHKLTLRKSSLPPAPHHPAKPLLSPTKIAIAQLDKEEGEISDNDEPAGREDLDRRSRFPGGARAGPTHDPRRRASISPIRQPSTRGRGGKKKQQQQRRLSLKERLSPVHPPAPTPSLPVSATFAKGKGKEMAPAAPAAPADTALASAAADISPEEAKQYMEIIRNLIFEGFSPETLVERGATPKYVMAVCEEIVEGTKKRQALWLETREQVRADSETPSIAPTIAPPTDEGKSPSPDVEVSIKPGLGPDMDMERVKSTSSESSAEYTLVERMSPPDRQPIGLIAGTSQPPQHAQHPQPRAGPSSHPVKIESYKPNSTVDKPPMPTPPTAPRSERYDPYAPSQLSLASRIPIPPPSSSNAVPHHAPRFNPGENQHPQRKGKKRTGKAWDSGLSIGSDVVLNYGDEDEAPPSASLPRRASLSERIGPSSSTADAVPPTSTPPPLPIELPPPDKQEVTEAVSATPNIVTEQASSAAESALQNALLESRRKALESMKRRRAALDAKPIQPVVTHKVIEEVNEEVNVDLSGPAAMALNKSIEEQMADIEKEVLNLQSESQVEESGASEDVDMDIDEPEEGEIISSNLPTPPSEPLMTSSTLSASAPVPRPPRGVKRLHAEDLMENRSTSAPSRIPPPQKRRLFGAIQRPQRLILHLDDSSDSSDEEDDAIPTPQPDPDILATQRLLAEKEESIRRLKEQIAAKMKARAKKKMEDNMTISTPMIQTPSIEGVPSVRAFMQRSVSGPGDQSPLPADVRELKQELIQAEAEVEAMDVDAAPSAEEPVPEEEIEELTHFTSYQALLPRYPQLNNIASHLPGVHIDDGSHPSLKDRGAISGLEIVDRPLLNSIILTNRLQREPGLKVCTAEAAGGKCADRTCKDLHLSKGVIPIEDDLVEYILRVTSSLEDDRRSTETIKMALAKAREDLASGSTKSGQQQQSAGKQALISDDQALSTLLGKVAVILREQP